MLRAQAGVLRTAYDALTGWVAPGGICGWPTCCGSSRHALLCCPTLHALPVEALHPESPSPPPLRAHACSMYDEMAGAARERRAPDLLPYLAAVEAAAERIAWVKMQVGRSRSHSIFVF